MNKRLKIVTLAAATLMALTPATANAKTKPSYSSKYWSTQRYVKVSHPTKAVEYKTVLKNKKLLINNKKVLKKATLKKGTLLYARSMGNGGWQIFNNQYKSSNNSVWLIQNQKTTKWFSLAPQPKAIPKYWSTARYVTVTKNVQGIQHSVTTKDKKLNIQNKILKKAQIKKGTKLYARSMGNGTWQVFNNQYPSNNKGVWLVNQDNTKWLKTTAVPKPTPAIASEYSKVSSDVISTNPDQPSIAYSPYGFKPINFQDNFTVNPGQEVKVYSDTQNNAWVFINNGKKYAIKKGSNFNVSTANSPIGSNNNIMSYLTPDDPGAFVPSTYEPQNGNLWMQLNTDGSVKQYYFYNNQDKNNTGWFKGKVEQKDGKSTIVADN